MVKLERHFDTEYERILLCKSLYIFGLLTLLLHFFLHRYGFPSTHTISGFVPLTLVVDLWSQGFIQESYVGYLLSIVWMISIMMSRCRESRSLMFLHQLHLLQNHMVHIFHRLWRIVFLKPTSVQKNEFQNFTFCKDFE